jgi:hypothetical protein
MSAATTMTSAGTTRTTALSRGSASSRTVTLKCDLLRRPHTLLRSSNMLILTRRVGETVMIGDKVTITVLGVKGN